MSYLLKLKLFLSGGGGKDDSTLLDKEFEKNIPQGKEIIYIPLASENFTPNEYSSWIASIFPNRKISLWHEFIPANFSQLTTAGAVYIGGGNTFKLLDLFRKKGFDEALSNYANNGGIIYGGSAGAIILGKDLSTCHGDVNKIGITDIKALNLLNNDKIWCHYKESDDSEILKLSSPNPGGRIIAISERTGVHFTEGSYKVVGFDPVYIFQNESKSTTTPENKFQ